MKLSIYNSYLNIKGRHTLVYNAYTGTFLALKNKTLSGNYETEILRLSPDEIKKFREGGMLVDDNLNETAELKKRISIADNNFEEFILFVNPTLDCNFQCWYCYEIHTEKVWMLNNIQDSCLAFVDTVLQRKELRNFRLSFFGGEPLLYFTKVAKPLITKIGKKCREYNVNLHVHFTSNGALLNKEIINFLSSYNISFQITLDGDKENHDSTRFYKGGIGSYDKIVSNITKLVQNGIRVICRINYTSANANSLKSVLDSFAELQNQEKDLISFDFQRVWQERGTSADDTDVSIKEIRNKYKRNGFYVSSNHLMQDVRNSCYGDKKNCLLINFDGNIYGCTARDFNTENCLGRLSESGELVLNKERYDRRANSKLAKPICQNCRIAPICGGGCKQRASESIESNTCTYGYSENDKDNLIIDIFEHQFIDNINL